MPESKRNGSGGRAGGPRRRSGGGREGGEREGAASAHAFRARESRKRHRAMEVSHMERKEGAEERVITHAFFVEAASGDGGVDDECPPHTSQECGGLWTRFYGGAAAGGGTGSEFQQDVRARVCGGAARSPSEKRPGYTPAHFANAWGLVTMGWGQECDREEEKGPRTATGVEKPWAFLELIQSPQPNSRFPRVVEVDVLAVVVVGEQRRSAPDRDRIRSLVARRSFAVFSLNSELDAGWSGVVLV
ncbi:hypothetical protein FIBSPDRAFT_900047 [Athelia psychrophila]|uniref:Uncharacterized protein n=1 Tax=Athelia psychrophila TaxID=1759441 RepID=A0A165YWI1_9AGAM|nr:hypothetical protein FIBSPDRAFT_900047 [Fibularhizoctonia sp. CBS 109695]